MPAKGLKILVCGGRNYGNYQHVSEVLNEIEPRFIIHGAAKGADRLGGRYAKEHGIECRAYPANWRPKGPAGPVNYRAGFDRNQQMLDEGKPELVVAFPGETGTDDMIKRARAAGVEVMRA